jgi:hypothetical protein
MPVLLMFSRRVHDTSRVVGMMIIGDATTWSVTYECHSDNLRCCLWL